MSDAPHRAGEVALVGRPNAGKSTLLNRLVGESVSIVTHKPQTTRHRIRGIVHRPGGQFVVVDTPGIHQRRDHALNRHLNRVAAESLRGVDVVVVLVDASRPTEEDRSAARAASQSGQPVILVFNKIDRIKDRERLLPMTEEWSESLRPVAVQYVSALSGDGVDDLVGTIIEQLPEGPPRFDPDLFTEESQRFLAAEKVREQLLENLHQEVPYGTTVVIESFEETPSRIEIAGRILVADARHKGILIGKGGQTLKRIGSRARAAIGELLGRRVHLELTVGVDEDWMNREERFPGLGYER
ncbi:MAG: GTPase Era [Wenzhouxiangellaceae bacterium]|nr:GTPase Era [Wenzhouxiangellaceae bacterium]